MQIRHPLLPPHGRIFSMADNHKTVCATVTHKAPLVRNGNGGTAIFSIWLDKPRNIELQISLIFSEIPRGAAAMETMGPILQFAGDFMLNKLTMLARAVPNADLSRTALEGLANDLAKGITALGRDWKLSSLKLNREYMFEAVVMKLLGQILNKSHPDDSRERRLRMARG
jgi:hypothetical protein